MIGAVRSWERLGDDVQLVHPSEYYGDLGSATAPSLLALAAFDLLKNTRAQSHLVYSSSDAGLRGALIVEKRPKAMEISKGEAI